VSCDEDHCITCSDAAVPMTVRRIHSTGLADCLDEAGTPSEVDVTLVAASEGDIVLVHAGVALAVGA
jgi:hydrogenase expression/formation protein HypC